MVKSILKLIKSVVSSRTGQILLIVHLGLVVYAFSAKHPSVDFSDLDLNCHGIPVADRAFQFCSETGLLKIVAVLDFVAIHIYALFSLALMFIGYFYSQAFGWQGPYIDLHIFSWMVAAVF